MNATSLASFVTLLNSGNSLPLLAPLKVVANVANLTTSAWQQLSSSINSVLDTALPGTAGGDIDINLGSLGNVAGIMAGDFEGILNNLKMTTGSSNTAGS